MNTCSNKSSSFKWNLPSRVRHSKGGGGGGGGGTCYNGLYGEVPPLRVIIFRLQVCEVCERVVKSVVQV